MEKSLITAENIELFISKLRSDERSQGTISKYVHDIKELASWLGEKDLTKESLCEWKNELIGLCLVPTTVNSMLAAINTYCKYMELNISVKFLKIQKKVFRERNKDLSKDEYLRLISAADKKGDSRLALLIETIGSTGIRVSEVHYITVEAAKAGRTQISLKGKIREILLPGKLCKKLLKYAQKQKIASGEIFITKSGRSMSRKQIWAEMKAVCKKAGIEPSKVFPHNLRHLFAKVFYRVTHDVAKLADLLGHSSIETTRIYLLSTGEEHIRQLERLELIL